MHATLLAGEAAALDCLMKSSLSLKNICWSLNIKVKLWLLTVVVFNTIKEPTAKIAQRLSKDQRLLAR